MPKLVISGGGATTASHADYINKSKGDKRLDEKIIFTSSTSGITHYKARTHLLEKKTGKEQYIKLLFSPEKGVFNKFGNTTEERLLAMEKVVQEGLGNLWKELGVKDVRWAAGTHTNTNHPHTHIIINTSVVDAVTGEPKTLPKIPRSWFWRKNNDNSVLAKLFEVPVAAHTIATPPENVLTKKPVSEVFFPAKELDQSRVEKTLNRLSEINGISPHWIEKLTDNQSLYVNRQGALTFVRRDVKGYATGYVYENGYQPEDKLGFFYVGNPKTATRFIVAETPKEVLAILELTGHRDLSEVCIVASDKKNAPAALTEFIKEASLERPMRVIWSLGLDRNNVQEAGNFADIQAVLLESRPEQSPSLEFVAWQPKPGYGHTWNDQVQSRNLPGELNGIVRKFLMADAPVIEPLNEVETKAYYEKVADAFSNVEIARENEEFVVYGKTLEGRGTEYGRFVFLPDLKAYDNNNDSNFEYKLISIVGKAYDSKNELFFSEEAEAVEQIKTLFGEHVSAEFQAAEGQWTVPEITTAESNLTEALSEVETVILNDQEMVSTTDVIADYQPPKLTYREVTEKLKEIPLEDVMPHLGLSLTYDRKRREYVYRDNGNSFKIAVKNDLFCDRYTGKGNRNAINLVREVLGVEFSEAKAFLLERLGIDYVPQETNDKAIVRNESQKEKRPFVMPERNDNKLHIVHDYLTVERGLDESIVNEQIEQGNIFANSFGSNTFVYRNEDGKILGAAWRAVVGTKRGDIAGTDKINAWFYLGDLKNASTVIVVEAPIEAMSYAQLHPDIDLKTTAIVSTSGSSVPASIVKILESNAGKDGRLVIAYNNDKGGHRGAENLLEKTGRFVLLDHKSHHLNNLIETTDFSGSILRDIPKLEDWNEDVKAARESEFQETDGEDTGDEIDSISRPVILPQADNVRLDSLEVVSMEGWHTSPDGQAREFPVSFDSITEFNRYIQTEKRAGASYKTDVKLTLNQGSELFQTFLVGEDLPDTLTGMLDRQIEMFERMKDLPQFTDQSEDVNAEIGSYKFIRNAVEQSYAEELKSFVSEDNPELFHADEEIRAGYTPEMIRATKINAPIHFKDYGQTEILLARENENEPFYTIGYRTRIGDDVIEKLPVPTDKKYAQGKQSLSNIYDELRRVLLACWQEKGEPRFTITETEINPDADKYLAFILNKTESYARDFSVRSFEKSFSVIPDFSEAEINVLRNWKTRTTNDAFFKIEDVFYKEIPNAKPYQNLMHKLINAGLVEVRQEGALTLVKGGNPLIAAAMSYLTENAVDSLKLTLGEARILELQFRKTEYAVLLGDRLSDDDREYYARQVEIISDEIEKLTDIAGSAKKSPTELVDAETPATEAVEAPVINLGENQLRDYQLLVENPLKGIYDRNAHNLNVAFNQAYLRDVEYSRGFEFKYRNRIVTVLDTEENGMLLNFRHEAGVNRGKDQNYTLGNLIHEGILSKENFQLLVQVSRTRQEIQSELQAANMNLNYRADYAPDVTYLPNTTAYRLNSKFSDGDYIFFRNTNDGTTTLFKQKVEVIKGQKVYSFGAEPNAIGIKTIGEAVALVRENENSLKLKQEKNAVLKFETENVQIAEYLAENFPASFQTAISQEIPEFLRSLELPEDAALIGYSIDNEISVYRRESRKGMVVFASRENKATTDYVTHSYVEFDRLEEIGETFSRKNEINNPPQLIEVEPATEISAQPQSEKAPETAQSDQTERISSIIQPLTSKSSGAEIEKTLATLFNARFVKENYDFTVTVAAAKDESRAYDIFYNTGKSHNYAQYRVYPPSPEFEEWSALKNNYNPLKSNKILNFEITDRSFENELEMVEFTARRIIKNEGLKYNAPMLVPTVLPSAQQEGRIEKRIAKLLIAHGLGEKIANASDGFEVRLENEPFMDLHITRDEGTNLIRLTHWYEQNGDLMHDGEMNFRLKDGKLSLNQVGTSLYGQTRYSYDRTFANTFSNNVIQQGFEKANLVQLRPAPAMEVIADEIRQTEISAEQLEEVGFNELEIIEDIDITEVKSAITEVAYEDLLNDNQRNFLIEKDLDITSESGKIVEISLMPRTEREKGSGSFVIQNEFGMLIRQSFKQSFTESTGTDRLIDAFYKGDFSTGDEISMRGFVENGQGTILKFHAEEIIHEFHNEGRQNTSVSEQSLVTIKTADENHLVSYATNGSEIQLTEVVSMLKTRVWLPSEIIEQHRIDGIFTFNDTLSPTGRTGVIYTDRDVTDFDRIHTAALEQLGLEGDFSDNEIENQRENAVLYSRALHLQKELDDEFAVKGLRNPWIAVAETGTNEIEIHGRTSTGKPDGLPAYSFYETEIKGQYQIAVGQVYPASQFQPEDFYFTTTDDLLGDYTTAVTKLAARLMEETNVSTNRIKENFRVSLGAETEPAGVKKGTIALAEEVREILHSGDSVGNNVAFNKLAERNFGGTRAAGTFDARDAYDALELGVNLYLLDCAKKHDFFAKPAETLREMRDLLRRLPTQSDRTDEQNLFQQFSTPPTESFAAYTALGAKKGDLILEPSAGNAGLAVWAKMQGVDIHTNEISDRRAGILKILGFGNVTRKDAQFLNDTLDQNIKPTLILMNPPFSSTGGRTKTNRTKYGAEHITDALKRLAPGGRLVAIVGEGMGFGKQGFTDWWANILNKYTVRANVGVPGEEYGKYGTTFGNQILVIDKIGATSGKTMQEQLANVIKGDMPNLEAVLTQMTDVAGTRPNTSNYGSMQLAEAVKVNRQNLLLPETVDLSPLEAVWFAENQDKLNRLGYETVALNDKTIAIKTSPTNIGFDKVRENFMNSLSALGNKETAPVVINVADDELFADQSSNIGKSQSDWTYDLDYRQEGYAKNVWNRAGDKTGAEYLVAVVQNGTYVDLKELGLSQEIQKEIYLSELNHRADDLVTLVEVNHDNPGTVFAALNKTTGELIHVRNEDLKPGDYNNVIYKSTLSQITRISSLTEELKDGIKNFAAENPALYKEVKALPTKVYDIGAGSMGNGTTIWNRADEENRDYKRIAHIGETGVISIYEQGMPEAAMLDIYSRAFSNAGEKEVLVPFNHENEKVAFAVVNKETGEVFSIGKNFEGKENQQIVVKNNFATVVKNYDGLATELKAGVDRLKTDDYQLYSKLNRTGSADGKLEQFAKMLQKDYPNLGFSYGYIGNVGTNYDDRSFKIFSRIPALGAVGQNASYGGFSKPEGLYEDVFERQGRFDRWLQNLAAKSELVTLEVKAELDSIIKTLDKPAERFLSGESKPQVIGEQESYNLARIEATGAIPGRIDRLEAAGYRIKFGEAAETIKDILVGKLSGNYADRFLEKGLTIEPIAFNKIERQEFISRSDLAANRDKIYLFGDNLRQAGFGGQAKEMRGEPNAFGIPTKMNPSNEPSAFFSDENIIDNKIAINEAFGKLARYAPDTVIVIPTAGLGTGLADLESRAPQTFAFLQEKLAKLEANASFTVEETQIEAVNRLKDEYTQLGANLREYFSNEKVTNIHSDVIAEINESGEIEARLHLFTDDPNNANSQNYFGKIEAEAGKSYVLSYGDIAETYTQISSIGDAIVIELMHRADEERADHEAVAAIENAPPTVYVGSTQETVQMQMSILAAVPVRERELEINNPLEAINLYEAGAIISKGVTGYSDTHGGGMDADWEEAQIARLVINGASENQVVSLIKQFEDVTQDVAIIVDGRDYQLSVTNNSFVENVLAVYQSDLLDDTAENEAEEAYELEEEEAYELEEDIDYGAFVLDEDEEIEAVGWIQLNEKELAVFASAAQEIVDNSGGQFGFLSNAKTPDEMTRAEFAGYTGSLVSKGLITVEEERKQVQMTAEGAKQLRLRGMFNSESFELPGLEWSRAIEPKKPAQAVSSVDREKTIYQPAVTIKNQLSDHLSKINWKENVVLKINQSEDAALPEVFVSIESEGRSKVIARISKNVAGYIYQPDGAASQVNALDYETMFDYLKEDIEAGHDFLAVQKREHLDIVAGKVNQSYSDTARVLNHYLTEQGRNDLEASVLVKNDGNSVESWINIIRYNYVKVEKNVIGRVTQGTDSFNFVIGTEENEVYEIENLARFIIEAEVKFRDQQKNPPVQEAGIPAIDMEAYENSTAQRPEFDWDAENNFSPEEVRADYFKETFALADSVLQLEGKTATNVYLTKSAELEHKKNIARLRQDKSDLAFHVSETGQYFGEASESYIRSELEARGISITKDYEVLVGHDRTAYLTRAEDAASTAEFDNPWDAWNENRFRGGEGADETAIRNDRLYRVIPQGELQVHLIQRAVALSAISEKGFAVAVKTNDGASGRAGEFFVYEGKNEIENQKFSSFSEAVKFLSENNDTGKFLEIPANYEFDTAFADNVQYAFYKFSGDGKPLDYLIEAKEIIGEDTVEAEIEGIRFKFTESDAVYEQAENIGRVFKTTAEINNFIRETEKPEDPALYYKTDVVVTLTDGTSFTGTIDIGTKSLAHFGDGNYIEQLVRENRTSAVALLEDYHDSNNLNSTEQNAIEYQKRIETGDRILKAIAAELPVQINQEIKTPTVTVANTGAKPTNESNTRTNGLGNNSAVNSGTSRIQPSLFESANNADGFHAGYDAGNTDVSANERQSGRSNGKTEGNQSAAAVSPINAGQTGINHAQATGNVSGSDQGKSATGVIENAPVEIITADSLGIGKNTEKRERIDNLGVVEYKPAKLTKGMKHPADIVESASMAAVVTPDITYTPRLDRQIIDKGLLSSLQLETVIYTGQRHELRLGDGNRAGFFIGDGTGVGKGRELAGIALDNWNQGRQRILWLSINYDLVPSTERDMKGLGASDVPFHTLNKHTVHADLEESIGDGLLFASYSTLTGKGKDGATRFDQIVKWLGEDGVIMFDEGHLAKNAVSFGMSQASQRGEAVVDLQIGDKSNPNWRIVYSSATGATELRNMAYMQRLGLWGEGSGFPGGFIEFHNTIDRGGVGSMEMVARDMKAAGMYCSRSLSMRGVDYRSVHHALTPEQKEIYNVAARAWAEVARSFDDALNETNANGKAKGMARARLYSGQQMFFRQLMTAMKVPALIAETERVQNEGSTYVDPKTGESKQVPAQVVIGVIGTGEARTKEQVSKAMEFGLDLDELDFSPKQILLNVVEAAYPVKRFTEEYDPMSGQTIKVPVVDSDGKHVESIEAIEMRDALLHDLEQKVTLPDNPLDQIVNYFGESAVAEITGRNKRIIIDPENGTRSYVKRAREGVAMDKASQDEMNAFQASRKGTAIISQSASTGISLHAELKPILADYVGRRKLTEERAAEIQNEWNQNADVEAVREMLQVHDLDIFRRVHITLETAWSADTQMQTFGRTHRSNELLPPEYVLMSTDLGGEKRFLATIAKRLGSLGALTKGDREQAGGGNLLDYDFENKYGMEAAKKIITMMRDGKPAFMTMLPLEPLTGNERGGLELLYTMGIAKREGNLYTVPDKVLEDLEVSKFLNRVLMLDVETQNTVFDGFVQEMEALITHDKELGLFDEGVKDIEGTNIRLADEPRVVSTDKMSGAETLYYKVNADTPTAPVTLRQIEERNRVVRVGGLEMNTQNNKGVFYQQRNSKNIIYTEYVSTRAEATTGAMVKHYKFARPSGWQTSLLTEKDLLDKYVPVQLHERREFSEETVMEVKEWWNKEVSDTPPSRVQDYHLIAGAVLPVWQRLAQTNEKGDQMSLRTVRIETEEGERIVGVEIPARQINRVLRDLGVQQSFKTPEEVFDAVLETKETIDLVGGIRLRPTFLKKQPAIEIMNLSLFQKNEFQNYGAQKEIISFSDKYYVPTDKTKGVEVLAKVLERYPAVDKTEERVQAQTVIKENKTAGLSGVINKAIENLSVKNFGDGALAKVSEKSTGFAAQAAFLRDKQLSQYWWMMTAEANDKGQIKINAATYEFIRVAYRQTFHEDIKTFDGLFDDADRADRFMQTMDYMEENCGIYCDAVASITKTIAEARNAREDKALIFLTDDKLSTRQHEESHAVSYSASAGKTLIERHARFDELVATEAYTISKPFLANLRGTDDDGLLVEETFAYISSGEGWKIGLLPDDIADFGTLWYKSFAEKNGDISILKFKEMTDESKQIRDRAYREIKLEQSERERLARNGFTAGSERGGVVGNAEEGTRYARGDFGAESDARQGAEYLENRIAEIKSSLLFGYQMEEENSFDLHPAIYTEVSKDLLAAREFIEVELPELKSEGISEDVYLERLKEFNFEPHTRDNQIEAFYKTSYENIYVTTTGKAVIFEGEETLPASDDDILAAAVEKQLLSEGVSNSSETELFLPEQEDVMPENTIRQQFAENPIIETAFSKGERVGAGALYKLSTEIDSEEISEILEDYGINTPEGNDVKVLAAYVEKYPQATGELISFAADRDLIRDERYDEMSAEQAFDSSEARFEMYARQVSRELARPINSEKGAALYKQSETESTGKIKGDEIFTDFQSIFVKAGLENALEAKEATIDFETPGRYPARFQLEIGEDEIKFSEKRVIEGKRSEFADPERGITFGKNERGNFQYTGSFERDEQGEIAGSEYDKAAGMDDILRWQYLGNNLVVTRIDADEKLASDVNTINRSNLEKYLSRHLGDELLAEIKAGTAAFEAQKFENNLKNERLKVSASIGEKEETKEISFADLERMRSAIARSNVANAKKTGILEMISEDEKKPLDAVEKQQYAKELAKAGQMQKPWIAALNDAVSAETARLAELRSESLAGLKEAMAETKEVAKQAGIEDTSEIKPILPPEKIWLEQIKAVKRSDAETFTRLEAINQAAGIPRPNDVYARLRGMETIAAMNAREENRNLVEWVGQKKLHDKTVLINVREEKGALKLEAWRVKDAEQKHDQLTADAKENTKRADSERDQAVQKALQPLINKINPFSPMQGQAGWLTRPKQTLNVHINPIEVIKQDAAIQVVRAVAGYIEHKGKADQMSKLAEAAIKEAAFLKDELASDIVANAGKLTEAVAAAVNAEEALRKDLKMNPSINAELLETPERGLTDAELRQIGHGAMETGDVNQTREYLDLVKKDAEFAESVGETKETLTTKSLLSEARAAWQARQTIESVKLRDDGSVDVEINPAQFSQAVEAIETADVIEEVQSVVASKSIVSTLSLEEVAQAERFLNANNQIAESLNSQVADLGQNLMRELQPPMTETEQKIFKEMAFSESTHRQFEEIRDQGIISDIRAQQAEFATQNNIQFQQTAHNMTVTNPNDMLEEKELKFWQDDRTQREDKIAREKAVLRMSMADSEKAAQDAADLEEIELLEKVEAAEIPLAKTLV